VTADASSNVELVLTCGIALHRAGDARGAALGQRLERMRPEPISAIMQWHAATGGLTRAFEMMAALRVANNLPPNLAFDPLFEALRNDARYRNP
jgi:hypothetical protein